MSAYRRSRRCGSYARATAWIADNGDTSWLKAVDDDKAIPSVTASLVADLFGRTDEDVARDITRALRGHATKRQAS
jgi:hypothetical protein